MAGQEQQQEEKKIGFKTIILLKDQTLGIGSYGAVYKAKCDNLICAAKIIHPTLFDPTALHQIATHREHRLPIRRFQQECEFLSTIRHPNIIQYLGTHQDPETCLPVLLMELMDNSLTHFLESSPQLIPYHIQVNICHDITLALSFLHSNGIVHRDLSSNNVLLIGNIRAKLTDFGMARLGDQNLHAARVANTICPGTDVYMPPEAVQNQPVYTEKIDCFSFGVITVQIWTREFPKPGDRQMTINDSRYPRGALKLCVPEIERRQNHISQVDPNHPLLPIALDCLKNNDGERPSAQQLCDRVAALKETAKYKNASERVKDSSGKDGELRHVIDQRDATICEKEEQLRLCREELSQQIQQLERDKQQAERERDQEKLEKERELGRVNQQLEECERLTADSGKRNTELEELLRVLKRLVLEKDSWDLDELKREIESSLQSPAASPSVSQSFRVADLQNLAAALRSVTISIASIRDGDVALFMNDSYGNYLAVAFDKLYFLNDSSAKKLNDLSTMVPQLNLKRKILIGKVTGRIHVEVRKEGNRLKLPVGTRMYKIDAVAILPAPDTTTT